MLNQIIRLTFVALAVGVAESLRRQLAQRHLPIDDPCISTEEQWEGEGGAIIARASEVELQQG